MIASVGVCIMPDPTFTMWHRWSISPEKTIQNMMGLRKSTERIKGIEGSLNEKQNHFMRLEGKQEST